MDKLLPIMEIDFHLLDLRYGHTRITEGKALAKMMNSIHSYGQLVPALAIPEKDKFILIDGYLRLRALKACGHDCIKIRVVEENEADALFILLAKNNERQWEVIEQASLIKELHIRFSYSFGEIAKRLARDKSWVKRRLDLIDSLPEEISRAVMSGKLSSWSASHVLVPLSRVNEQDAIHLTEKIIKDPLSTRELSHLYEQYKKSNRIIRDRIIANPSLFARTLRQQEQNHVAKQVDEGPEGKWLKDITVVCHILKRLHNTSEYVFFPNQEHAQRRRYQIWIQNAEQMIIELKARAERKCNDNTSIPTDNSGDVHQGCELT